MIIKAPSWGFYNYMSLWICLKVDLILLSLQVRQKDTIKEKLA